VFLFATGGTISNKTGGRLTVDELIKSVPNLAGASGPTATIHGRERRHHDGPVALAGAKDQRQVQEEQDLAGIVVPRAPTRSRARLFSPSDRARRTAVVVGSMRNPSGRGEGVANLEDAFVVAADPAARDMGTLVVSMTRSTRRARSPNGLAAAEHVQFARLRSARHCFSTAWRSSATRPQTFGKRVRRIAITCRASTSSSPGRAGDLIKAAVDNGARAS
jgi:hypothetical protein